MNYSLSSLLTRSYWLYALFNWEALGSIFAALGVQYFVLEIGDFFQWVPKESHTLWTAILMAGIAVVYTLVTRRPTRRVRYRSPSKDVIYEVRIGNLLECKGQIVISTNTTFDTDTASGLIAADSVQGQFTRKFFEGNIDDLDRQIERSLKGVPSVPAESPGKRKRYPMGTVAKVKAHGQIFYLFAMAELNAHGTAKAPTDLLEDPLTKLWDFVGEQGEFGDLVVPVIGTGRGRLKTSRRKVIDGIIQSFADATYDKKIANRLTIVITEKDAIEYNINLFQIRDYIALSLHP